MKAILYIVLFTMFASCSSESEPMEKKVQPADSTWTSQYFNVEVTFDSSIYQMDSIYEDSLNLLLPIQDISSGSLYTIQILNIDSTSKQIDSMYLAGHLEKILGLNPSNELISESDTVMHNIRFHKYTVKHFMDSGEEFLSTAFLSLGSKKHLEIQFFSRPSEDKPNVIDVQNQLFELNKRTRISLE